MLMNKTQWTDEMIATTSAAVKLPAIIFRLHPACAYGIGGIGTNERFLRTLESSKGKQLEPKTEKDYTGAGITARAKWRLSA